MKLCILTTALILAAPAMAQEAGSSSGTTSGDRFFTSVDGFKGERTPGGYQPAGSALSSPPAPGDIVEFRAQPLTPEQAFPSPAPLADYPPCAAKQYDRCMQRK
ncbi:hypothetical protein [Sphingomonas faeni]|uniref:hypothetical protein n=1 Tax=Sphingomonas faeni TaxID=185950 RepID=UPI00277DD8CE|nr:hypothetical protein [Sphingomonas faeni]MDQ0839329.1 hypothetical protein [Sphingomonas faeni]